MKKLFSFMLILAVMLSTSVVAYAEEYVPAYDEEIIAIPAGQNQTTSIDIPLGNNNVVTLSVSEVNGMVYADAHGRYFNKSNGSGAGRADRLPVSARRDRLLYRLCAGR